MVGFFKKYQNLDNSCSPLQLSPVFLYSLVDVIYGIVWLFELLSPYQGIGGGLHPTALLFIYFLEKAINGV